MRLNLHGTITKFLIVIAVAVSLFWGIVRTKVLSAKIVVSWSYDYDPLPACASPQDKSCIDHFEVEDITNQQNFVLIQKVPNPGPAFGKVDHISATFKYGPPFGERAICVVAVGKDDKGNRITSNPFAARASVSIRPGTAASVTF